MAMPWHYYDRRSWSDPEAFFVLILRNGDSITCTTEDGVLCCQQGHADGSAAWPAWRMQHQHNDFGDDWTCSNSLFDTQLVYCNWMCCNYMHCSYTHQCMHPSVCWFPNNLHTDQTAHFQEFQEVEQVDTIDHVWGIDKQHAALEEFFPAESNVLGAEAASLTKEETRPIITVQQLEARLLANALKARGPLEEELQQLATVDEVCTVAQSTQQRKRPFDNEHAKQQQTINKIPS